MPLPGTGVTLRPMGDNSRTLPPPGPHRVDIARVDLRRLAAVREEPHSRAQAPRPALDEDQVATAFAALEGRLLARMAELHEDDDRPSHLRVEVAPLPEPKKGWLHSVGGTLTGIAACLAGATALVGASIALWNQVKPIPPIDYSKDIKTLQRGQLLTAQQFQLQSKYDSALRTRVCGYFTAMGVKIPPELGDVPCEPAELLATPLGDPHKVTKTSRVQPRDPLPLPPTLPPEFDPPKP